MLTWPCLSFFIADRGTVAMTPTYFHIVILNPMCVTYQDSGAENWLSFGVFFFLGGGFTRD